MAIAMLAIGAAPAQAQEAGSGPNPFTDCGIGAALFPNTHWAAVTSNVIWDIGTTAVISATASPETCQGASTKAANYIHDVYDSVLEDTARGEGDHLVALLEIYGCAVETQTDVIDAIRDDIGAAVGEDSFSEQSHLEKAEQYFTVIDSEIRSNHSATCTA